MRNFLFYDNDSGEHFIVEAESLAEAKFTAKDWFGEAVGYIDEISDEEADMLGYDTF